MLPLSKEARQVMANEFERYKFPFTTCENVNETYGDALISMLIVSYYYEAIEILKEKNINAYDLADYISNNQKKWFDYIDTHLDAYFYIDITKALNC